MLIYAGTGLGVGEVSVVNVAPSWVESRPPNGCVIRFQRPTAFPKPSPGPRPGELPQNPIPEAREPRHAFLDQACAGDAALRAEV